MNLSNMNLPFNELPMMNLPFNELPMMNLPCNELTKMNLLDMSNRRTTKLFSIGKATRIREVKVNSNQLYSARKFTLCHILFIAVGLGKCIHSPFHVYIYIYIYIYIYLYIYIYMYIYIYIYQPLCMIRM